MLKPTSKKTLEDRRRYVVLETSMPRALFSLAT